MIRQLKLGRRSFHMGNVFLFVGMNLKKALVLELDSAPKILTSLCALEAISLGVPISQ